MKKYLILSVLFITGALMSSCNEWDDHYHAGTSENENVSDLNIYDYLNSQPEYSRFMELMEETEVAKELGKNQILTVWAISNSNMPADWSQYSESDLKRLAENQINYMSLPENKISAGKRIKTMAKKNVVFTKTVEDKLALDGKEIVKPNQFCSNGVVNEIMGLLMPRDNVLEALARLDDNYSILRDTVLSYCDTIFDEENSYPLYVDEDGSTVYDSIWIITSPFFRSGGDFRNEELEFTMVKFNNDVFRSAMINIMKDYTGMTSDEIYDPATGVWNYGNLRSYEFEFLYKWGIYAFLYEGYQFDYNRNEELTSLWGMLWKTEVQRPSSRIFERGSNCVIYDIEFLHTPRNILASNIIFDVAETFYPQVVLNYPDKLDEWFKYTPLGEDITHGTRTSLNPLWNSSGKWWFLSMSPWNNETNDLWYEFTVLTNSRGPIEPARFFPGIYKVEASVRPYAAGNMNVYFNGQLVAGNSNSDSWGNTSGVVYVEPPLTEGKGKFTVTEPGPLVIRWEVKKGVEAAGNKRIAMHGWKFSPDLTIY